MLTLSSGLLSTFHPGHPCWSPQGLLLDGPAQAFHGSSTLPHVSSRAVLQLCSYGYPPPYRAHRARKEAGLHSTAAGPAMDSDGQNTWWSAYPQPGPAALGVFPGAEGLRVRGGQREDTLSSLGSLSCCSQPPNSSPLCQQAAGIWHLLEVIARVGWGGVIAATGDFFAKKCPIMANMDPFGHKGFLEWIYKHGM